MLGYCDKNFAVFMKKAANKATSVDLTSAAVADVSYVFGCQAKVKRIGFIVTTATVSTGSIVMAFKQYPVAGSSSNAVTIGSLTIPTGVAAGAVYYKDLSGTVMVPGDELVCQVTTAAAGGGAAGVGYYFFELERDPEYASNQSDMVASA